MTSSDREYLIGADDPDVARDVAVNRLQAEVESVADAYGHLPRRSLAGLVGATVALVVVGLLAGAAIGLAVRICVWAWNW